jgi:FkbM family methyltransferase
MSGIIHVGAWDGREYEEVAGPLLLIEPQAGPFNIMREKFKDRRDVELHCVAAGAEPGEATIHTAYPDHSSSLLHPKVASRFDGAIKFARKVEVVRMATLDSIVRGRSDYNLLRVDTQGYELEVLRGATDTLFRLGRVEVEIHDPDVYDGAATLEQVDRLLAAAGFTRVDWDTEGSDDLGDAVYAREQIAT